VRVEYAGTIEEGGHFEVADSQPVKARLLIVVLGCGSQSCVWADAEAGQRHQENGGEARQISLHHPFNHPCGNFHRFV
jgi:hypothetical protein